jgi:hypothetical protein
LRLNLCLEIIGIVANIPDKAEGEHEVKNIAINLELSGFICIRFEHSFDVAGKFAPFSLGIEDEIIFLHQVQEGGADRSYGIEVGRLVGLPPSVISRAKQVLEQIAKNSHVATGLRSGGSSNKSAKSSKSGDLGDRPEKNSIKSSKELSQKAQMTIFDTPLSF